MPIDIQPNLAPFSLPQISPIVQPAATPSAVEMLVDAFRKGEVSAIDIADRATGVESQARRQAARELISPESIQARSTARQVQTFQQQADLNNKYAHERYLQAGLPILYTKEGAIDHAAMSQHGAALIQADEEMKTALMGLQGQPAVVQEKGKQYVVKQNALGENVSPGSEAYNRYHKMLTHSSSVLHSQVKPSGIPAEAQPKIDLNQVFGAPGEKPAEKPSIFPVTMPGTPADLVKPIQDMPAAGPRLTIEPAGAPAVRVVARTPTAVGPPGKPVVAGIATGGDLEGAAEYLGDIPKATEMMKDVRSQELYKNWAEKSPSISRFRAIAASYGPEAKGEVTTQKDIALATAARQIIALGTSASSRSSPELMGRALDEAEYFLDRIRNLPEKALKKELLTPQARKRIIEETQRAVEALESDARGVLQTSASSISTSTMAKPERFLYPQELNLLKGTPGTTSRQLGGFQKTVQLGGRTFTLSQ